MLTYSMTSHDLLQVGAVACAWWRLQSLTVFLVIIAIDGMVDGVVVNSSEV